MSAGPLLSVENLRTYFYSRSRRAFVRSVDGLSFEIEKGETLGLMGESGSGKSVAALSIMGLVDGHPGVVQGKIGLKTENTRKDLLHGLDECVRIPSGSDRLTDVRKNHRRWQKHVGILMRNIRGREIAMIFQSSGPALNPFVTIGRQITEAVLQGTAVQNRHEARERATQWLERVKIDSPSLRYHHYPHELSVGMCRRAMIAMALASEPALLVADEPIAGLDATVQSKIVELLGEIRSSLGFSMLLISRDIDVIRALADTVAVMYAGKIVEQGPADLLFSSIGIPRHPYTEALLASFPDPQQIRGKVRLNVIRGEAPDPVNMPGGCRFYPRCERVTENIRQRCCEEDPELLQIASGHKVRCWLYPEVV